MGNELLVSIITVSYNSENTIRDTIESVLEQTYPNIEYLIIDGLSTDETFEIAKSYVDKFKERGYKFSIVTEKDCGIYDAMNKGIRMSIGEIIGIINSDDWYEKNAIQRVVEIYESNEFDYFYADMCVVKGKRRMIKKAKLRKYPTSRDWNHPTTFVVRELYNHMQYNIVGIYSDFDYYLKVRNGGYRIVILNEVLANFRFGGISNKKSIKSLISRIKEYYQIFIDNGYSSWFIVESILKEVLKFIIS